MKYILTSEDILKIVSDALQNKFQSGCEFAPTHYVYIPDLTMVEMTQDEIDRRAAHEVELEAFRQKMMAEEAAKKAAAEAVSVASQPGNF